jgi:hypothetical protein
MSMDHNPFDLESQDIQKAQLDTDRREERETEEADLKWLMGSRRGRRVVWRLLEQAGVFRSSFNPTAMVMAFNEGNRNYGVRTLSLIHEHCPEVYLIMLKENANGKPDRAKQ